MLPVARRNASPRQCVYTVLTGQYETLNEQPAASDSALPFFCFTDDPALSSATWQIRPLARVFPDDPVRSQRACKLRPHHYLPEFDLSLYIDNSVVLDVAPEHLFDVEDLSTGLCLPEHSFRDTVLDEFDAIAEQSLDDPARVLRQLERYSADNPSVLDCKPFWCGILLRDHRNARVRAAMEIWFDHVSRHSRRDQLSCCAALEAAGLRASHMQIDNHQSWFHSWPHLRERDTARRCWPPPRDSVGAAAKVALAGRIASLRAHGGAVASAAQHRSAAD